MFASAKHLLAKPAVARAFSTQAKNTTAKVYIDKNTRYERSQCQTRSARHTSTRMNSNGTLDSPPPLYVSSPSPCSVSSARASPVSRYVQSAHLTSERVRRIPDDDDRPPDRTRPTPTTINEEMIHTMQPSTNTHSYFSSFFSSSFSFFLTSLS